MYHLVDQCAVATKSKLQLVAVLALHEGTQFVMKLFAIHLCSTLTAVLTHRDRLEELERFCGLRIFGYNIGIVGKHYIKQQILNFKLTDTVTW